MSGEPTREEIDEFIRQNDVDSRAGDDLCECPPDIQRKVLARGELSTARNPSAALLARIRDARLSVTNSAFSSGISRGSQDIEDFIKDNDVDESAADSLRSASPGVQRAVIARGDLRSARNPSSALLARIRDARAGGGGGSFGGGFGAPPASAYPPQAGYAGYSGYATPPCYGGGAFGAPGGYGGAYAMPPGYGTPGAYGMPPASAYGATPGYPPMGAYSMPAGGAYAAYGMYGSSQSPRTGSDGAAYGARDQKPGGSDPMAPGGYGAQMSGYGMHPCGGYGMGPGAYATPSTTLASAQHKSNRRHRGRSSSSSASAIRSRSRHGRKRR